jgi:1-phosphatidylinositol-3-phosphate 5-kinase
VICHALLHGKWLELAYQSNTTNTSTTSSIANLASLYSNATLNSSAKLSDMTASGGANSSSLVFYDDNTLYKPGYAALNMHQDDSVNDQKKKDLQDDTEEGPEWIKELNSLIVSTYDLTSNKNEENKKIKEQQQQQQQKTTFTIGPSSPNPSVKSLNLSDMSYSYLKQNDDKNEDRLSISSSSSSSHVPMTKLTPSRSIFVDDNQPVTNLNIISSALPSTPTQTSTNLTINHFTKSISHRTLSNVNDELTHIHKQLQVEILKQLLKLKNLSFDWFDIIINLVWQSVHLVKPDVKHDNDSMDIRSYIKIKKLPCMASMTKQDSKIINGLVFTKNVAHKQMKQDIKAPKVLLLRSSIEYQRTEEKLCSLEPILHAESQYLRNYCSKLLLRQSPNILIVEKSVARTAQEFFLQSDISLVLNLKSSLMDKLGRFLQADPMYSIDDPIRKPKLGFCSRFHVETYELEGKQLKSLMFFEGTPTNLGCTILLSGASNSELTIVKSLMKFMIYVVYNSKLEHSFIIDKYADFLLKNTIFEHKFHDSVNKTDLEDNNEPKKSSFMSSLITVKKSNTDLTQSENNKSIQPLKLNNQISSLIKKEISVNQSPLDDLNFKINKDDDDDEENMINKNDENNDEFNNQAESASSDLKLKICEQHKEKSSISMTRNFKLLLDDLILSISPFIKYQLPYLLSDTSAQDPLKNYLPKSYINYLQSSILLMDSPSVSSNNSSSNSGTTPNSNGDSKSSSAKINHNPNGKDHEFLSIHLTKSFDDLEIRKLYADYKSRGGIAGLNKSNQPPKRLILKNIEASASQNNNNHTKSSSGKNDCLDIFNRQNLAVLFYSQCETSPVYPNICHKPKVINMKYYSENDMTLGSFLAKNCFRAGHKCNNTECNTLIVNHTRL